ncbi:MAG: phosphatase PAP2 family protein, partial [Syntrophomonadaceae bacterium]|nr:phosphatase PAP2 family protein [Syntrophomonadaceae bacterium]
TVFISFYLLSKQNIYEAIFLNISLFSAWGMMSLLKNLFERSRPAGEALTIAAGFSLPSGHAMLAMAFYGFLAALLLRHRKRSRARWGAVLLFIWVILVGFSRIYLNVHYLSDVLSGFVFGFICMILSLAGLERVRRC